MSAVSTEGGSTVPGNQGELVNDLSPRPAGTCTACGVLLFRYTGQIDARSHPRAVVELTDPPGLMCSECICNGANCTPDSADDATTLVVCPNGCSSPRWRYVEAIEVWREVLEVTPASLTVNSYWQTGDGYNDGLEGSAYLQCWDCAEQVPLPAGVELEWD